MCLKHAHCGIYLKNIKTTNVCYRTASFICSTYKQTTITDSQYCCLFWQAILIWASSTPHLLLSPLLDSLLSSSPHNTSILYSFLSKLLLLVGVVAEQRGAEYQQTALTRCDTASSSQWHHNTHRADCTGSFTRTLIHAHMDLLILSATDTHG